MIKLGVIEEATGPTDWCNPLVIAMKANGKIRICTDMTKLNKAVKREIHPIFTVEASLAKIKGKLFRKLDANSGFWQIPFNTKLEINDIPDTLGKILLQEITIRSNISTQDIL